MGIPNNWREKIFFLIGVIFCIATSLLSMYLLFLHYDALHIKNGHEQGAAVNGANHPVAQIHNFSLESEGLGENKSEPLSVQAQYAELFLQKKKINLRGDVRLTYHNAIVEGSSLNIDYQQGIMGSSEQITVRHEYGCQTAGSFYMTMSDKEIHFNEPVHAEFTLPELQQVQ